VLPINGSLILCVISLTYIRPIDLRVLCVFVVRSSPSLARLYLRTHFSPDSGEEKRLRGDFFDFLKKVGITAAIKNPIPKEKANKMPMGTLIDSNCRNFKETGWIFWIAKTAIVIIQPPTIALAKKLVIVFMLVLARFVGYFLTFCRLSR